MLPGISCKFLKSTNLTIVYTGPVFISSDVTTTTLALFLRNVKYLIEETAQKLVKSKCFCKV